ncbi:MAG: LysR family transcriptional regulator [Pseudomonadota bacterium]
MKIEDVALFERIASLGSVSAAGRALGLSATIASDRLARLERDLGCTLARRTTRKLTLTDEGESFLVRARELMALYEGARESVGVRASVISGTVHLTAPAYFGRLFLLPVLEQFLDTHPAVNLKISLGDNVLDYIGAGVDVALRIGSMPDSSFKAQKLAGNDRVLCATPGFVARHGVPKDPEDLSHLPCIVLGGEDVWRFRRGDVHAQVAVRPRLSTDSAEVVKSAVLAGLGIAERSLWDVRTDLAEGRLIRMLPEVEIDTDMAIWLVYPPGRYRSRASRALSEVLACEIPRLLSEALGLPGG